MSTTVASTAARGATRDTSFDVSRVRKDFPILRRTVYGHPLVYLDNAATSQKPRCVLDAVTHYYEAENANVHRGVHYLSARATEAYEAARAKVGRFVNASDDREIVFVRGTTEAINLVAHAYGRPRVEAGDAVLISAMEHHSNIVPWQMLCEERGARLQVIPMNDRGELVLDEYQHLLTERTKLVAVNHVSNALGTINPVKEMAAMARAHGIPVLVDGAQAAPHLPVDVQDLGCDFYTISGHKMFGPTGIGALYGRAEVLEAMEPYQGGGEMIRSVTFEKTTYAPIPAKFEAGTPNIAGAVGLGAAIDYLESLGWDGIARHEADLARYTAKRLGAIDGLRPIGTASHKASVFSFTIEGVHAHDVGTIVDQKGIAIRTGHHCAQPVMDFYGVAATARASLALYNTVEEIDRLAEALSGVRGMFA